MARVVGMRGFKTLVLGIDFAATTDELLHMAAELADLYEAHRVHLVHVVSLPTAVLPGLSLTPDTAEGMKKKAQERLEGLSLGEGNLTVTREVRTGAPARELAHAAQAVHADLILVAGRNHGMLTEMFLGSVASSLIRVARCPVLMMAGVQPKARFQEILAAVDLSPISLPVLENAFRVASRNQAHVRVLSLFEHPLLKADAETMLPRALNSADIESLGEEHRKAVEELLARIPIQGARVDVEVMSKAPAANAIVDVAKFTEADLIVLGTSGQGGWHRMILGSTANFVLNRAPCPVLVVPHEVTEKAPQSAGAAIPV